MYVYAVRSLRKAYSVQQCRSLLTVIPASMSLCSAPKPSLTHRYVQKHSEIMMAHQCTDYFV